MPVLWKTISGVIGATVDSLRAEREWVRPVGLCDAASFGIGLRATVGGRRLHHGSGGDR
jgi:hypothetical protein